MGIFGWSLPPGCGRLPGEEPCVCEVCGMVEDCCCPECPACGEQGNPKCYAEGGHGLALNDEQKASRAEADARNAAEDDYFAALVNEADAEAADFRRYEAEQATRHVPTTDDDPDAEFPW